MARALVLLLAAAVTLSSGASPRRTSLASGVLLVSSTTLADQNFASTVVLLLEYGDDGARGVVVNRKSRLELGALLPELEATHARELSLFYGGPVRPARVAFLVRSREPIADAREVVAGVHVAGSLHDVEEALGAGGGQERVRAYAGYAGWAPGQLEAEVARGDWHVVEARAREVFERAPQDLWQRLIDGLHNLEARLGGRA